MQNQTSSNPQSNPSACHGGDLQFEPACALPGTALTCLNGLRHGGRAQALFISGEQPQDFYNMLAEDFATHKPSTTQDSGLVADATVARWLLWRRQRAYSISEFECYSHQTQADTLSPQDLRTLEPLDQYVTRASRALDRALKALRHLTKATLDEEKWRAQHDLQKKRFDLELQKFELRKEQAALKASDFKPADFAHHINLNSGIPVIEQTVHIFENAGRIKIDAKPSNEVVQKIIDNRRRFLSKTPQYVNRLHIFAGGRIPQPFQWTVQRLPPEALADLENPGRGVHNKIPLDAWKTVLDGEAAILAMQEAHSHKEAA